MSYTVRYKPHIGQGMGVRAYVGWSGQYDTDRSSPRSNVICVRRSGDGCIGIDISKRFLYPEEAEAVHEALGKLLRDAKHEKEAARRKWLSKTADAKVFFGYAVDLSRNETIAALGGEHRISGERTEILYRGQWLKLYRTDLKDDVGRFEPGQSIEHYRAKARECYGARLRDGGLGIVDQVSDG